jgi:hypothetical protein
MKVLQDECVPRKLKDHIAGHECRTVSEMGWAGKKNGELLALADSAGFQVFLTVDRGIEYQQSFDRPQRIAVVVIRAKSNRLADLIVYVPDLLQALKSIEPGQFMRISLIK